MVVDITLVEDRALFICSACGGYVMFAHFIYLITFIYLFESTASAWGWTSHSIHQPVPSPDKRGGSVSGARRM